MRFAWVWIAIALAGCEAGPGNNDLGLCSTVCRCAAPELPAQQDACVDECTAELDSVQFPSACEECVFTNASVCSHLAERCFGDGGPCRLPQPEPAIDGAEAGGAELGFSALEEDRR